MTDWDAIVRAHGPAVWRTACRLLTRAADAADCFQNTFVAAVERTAAEPVRDWPALLTRIATARALELLRARYRHAARSGALPDEGAADPSSPDPVATASGGELTDALRVALAALDPVPAEVFSLVCLDGFTNTEAAAALGLAPGHVGVLLHRARAALRERLRAFDPHRERAPGGRP